MMVDHSHYSVCDLDMDQSTAIQETAINEKLGLQGSVGGTRLAKPKSGYCSFPFRACH